ncbi:hypothetical protein MKW92_025404 [Papaver armeniacum]|nr:hypothetical protein MKW92_025404 [Papaver armeniacum]
MAMVQWCDGRILMMVERVAGQPSLPELFSHGKEQREGKNLKELLLIRDQRREAN